MLLIAQDSVAIVALYSMLLLVIENSVLLVDSGNVFNFFLECSSGLRMWLFTVVRIHNK